MRWTRGEFVVLSAVLVLPVLATTILTTSAFAASELVSHKQVQAIKVSGSQGATLQSMTRTSDGKIVALLGPSRNGGITGGASDASQASIQVFDKEGKKLSRWNIEFPGQAVAAGPGGSFFVGGNGKIARYNADGALLKEAELPHMAAMLADRDSLKQHALEQLKNQRRSSAQMKRTHAQQIKVLKSQIAKIEEKEVDEITASVKRQQEGLSPKARIFVDPEDLAPAVQRKLKRLKDQLATYEATHFPEEDDDDAKVEAVMQQLVQRAAKISGISATEKDVFVVCSEEQGYGFAAWRMDQNFENPSKVLSGLRGCCGQMDVQAIGDDLFVAENTKHRVGRYDRDGQRIREFGTRAAKGNADGFGGCCNPMNVCCGAKGEILTAESEGIIRRFSLTGEYLGLVGQVSLTGGCKNVAVSASPDGDQVYFCDLPGSRIIVMGRVSDEDEAKALAKPRRPARGTAVLVDGEDDQTSARQDEELSNQESGVGEEGATKLTSKDKARKSARPAKPAQRSTRTPARQPLRTRVYSDQGF